MNPTVNAAMIAGGDRYPAWVMDAFRERFTETVELFDPDMRTVEVMLGVPGWGKVSHVSGATLVEVAHHPTGWCIVVTETLLDGSAVTRQVYAV